MSLLESSKKAFKLIPLRPMINAIIGLIQLKCIETHIFLNSREIARTAIQSQENDNIILIVSSGNREWNVF